MSDQKTFDLDAAIRAAARRYGLNETPLRHAVVGDLTSLVSKEIARQAFLAGQEPPDAAAAERT